MAVPTASPLPAPPSAAVPMLDLSREWLAIRDEVLDAIEAVCAAQQFVLGPPAARFEAAAAAACSIPSAVGCASGTDALWLALAALGVGPGDTVVTSPFSFYATVSSILRVGAHPVLADIDPQSFNLAPAAVADVLAHQAVARNRPAALLPVHLYGQCADMDALLALARHHGLKLVEDAAQAFGARWLGRPAGSLGDAAAFSFYPTKNLAAYGDAGMVTTADPTVAARLLALRNHGMVRRYFHEDLGGPIGWNSRLDGIQAAILEIKLRRLPVANARRRELAALYSQSFERRGLAGTATRDGIVLPWVDARTTPIFHQYVIRAPRRDALRAYLTSQNIGSEIYYPLPLHLQDSLRFLGYQKGDFPNAELAAEEVLALPLFPELTNDEAETVVEAIANFYS